MSEPFNKHAADLINGVVDLIERALIKHSAAVLALWALVDKPEKWKQGEGAPQTRK